MQVGVLIYCFNLQNGLVLLAYSSDDPVNLGRLVICILKNCRNQFTIQTIVEIGVSCSIVHLSFYNHCASIIEDDIKISGHRKSGYIYSSKNRSGEGEVSILHVSHPVEEVQILIPYLDEEVTCLRN